MAQALVDEVDSWDTAIAPLYSYKEFADVHGSIKFARVPNSDYATRDETSPTQLARDHPPPLTELETIEVFRSAVDVARELVHKQGENEKIDAAVQPNLTLDLKRKGVESLPEEVIQIIKRDVERLVLSHNYVSYLPYRFLECATMQYLNLRGNRFSEFPKPLLRMEKLQILDLSRNNLNMLPEEIRNMKALRVLSVMHNRLSDLPLSLGNLESLRILKVIGNPINEQLRTIVDSNGSTTSPLTTPIAENEKDALLTLKIKQFLRHESHSFESGGESSESPLETPRPLKRNTSIRFPVVPATGAEPASDSRSPSISKPPIPHRSHYRMASGHNGTPQNTSFRRPSVSPLILGSERHRSNSENVVQAGQHPRNKRMGIVPRKTGLSPLEESSTNRNSLHLRGTSHGSVLKDRHGQGSVPASSIHRNGTDDYLQQPGTFIRGLSSVPEHKSNTTSACKTIEGAKGLLFSLHALHPYISSLLPLAGDEGSKRSSLERVFYNSSTHLDSLDHELFRHDAIPQKEDRQQRRSLHTIRRACRACIVAYTQVGKLLIKNAQQILVKGDQRYVRMLLLLVHGSNVEAVNALINLGTKDVQQSTLPHPQRTEGPNRGRNVPRLTVHGITPTQERPSNKGGRLRSDTANATRNHRQSFGQGHNKSATHPQSAVPLYINGRSRSNSRSHALNLSATSSVANTPGSGESFFIPATPMPSEPETNATEQVDSQGVMFEKIYLSLQKFVEQGQTALPHVCSVFGRCFEAVQSKHDNSTYVELWSRLYNRSRQTLELCYDLGSSLSALKLNDLEIRNSFDFWNRVIRFTNGFVSLCEEVKTATANNRDRMTPLDIPRLLKPVHKRVRAVFFSLRDSPWASVLANSASNQRVHVQSHWQNSINLHGASGPRLNGHYRSRDDSGSSSSPFMPTTPLSAALGPAAQATIPTASGSNSFDRSFQGDVFQRAEFALTMQHSAALHRRN